MPLEITIVNDSNDLQACFAVRAAAFLARGEPYSEEYDGNDLICATHFIARMDGEPVGTMRIRIISANEGGTAVWERLAITPKAGRSVAILYALASIAKEYSLFKGCHTVLGGVADPRLLKFWIKQGFQISNEKPVVYNGVSYIQVRRELLPDTSKASLADASLNEAERFRAAL